jgi:hypothetical protein
MSSLKKYKNRLLDYFSEVILIDKDPFIIEMEEIYKENGEIKRISSNKIINLRELILNKNTTDLISPECFDYGILTEIKKSNKVEFYYKYKNILDWVFNSRKELYNYLSSFDTNEYYLLTTPSISKSINNHTNLDIKEIECYDELSNDVLFKQIILFKKSASVYLYKKIHKYQDFEELVSVKYGVDLDDFIVINLI